MTKKDKKKEIKKTINNKSKSNGTNLVTTLYFLVAGKNI